MNQNECLTEELHGHVDKNGTKGLLPQNLTDRLLNGMNREASDISEGKKNEPIAPLLLTAILFLENGPEAFGGGETKTNPELVMEHFDLYVLAVRLEYMRRMKVIEISNDSLPTLENIFDLHRSMNVSGLDKY